MRRRTLVPIIMLCGLLAGLRTEAQQADSILLRSDTSLRMDMSPYEMDSTTRAEPTGPSDPDPDKRSHYYGLWTPGTGVGKLFAGNNNGLLNVSFPFRLNGAPLTFHSGTINPYAMSKVFVLPLELEGGDAHQFIDMGVSFSIIGKWTGGYNFSVGYGRNFFLGSLKHSKTIEGKALVLKPSVSLSFTRDAGRNKDAALGSIDNEGNTIQALGNVAGPTYDVTTYTTDDDGNSFSSTDTYDANSLDVMWVEHEFAIVPKIALASNPYRKGLHWALTAGYNIPLHERGGISLVQNAGSSNSNTVANLIDLRHPGIIATFNGRPISATPFQFSGFYLSFAFSFSLCKD